MPFFRWTMLNFPMCSGVLVLEAMPLMLRMNVPGGICAVATTERSAFSEPGNVVVPSRMGDPTL